MFVVRQDRTCQERLQRVHKKRKDDKDAERARKGLPPYVPPNRGNQPLKSLDTEAPEPDYTPVGGMTTEDCSPLTTQEEHAAEQLDLDFVPFESTQDIENCNVEDEKDEYAEYLDEADARFYWEMQQTLVADMIVPSPPTATHERPASKRRAQNFRIGHHYGCADECCQEAAEEEMRQAVTSAINGIPDLEVEEPEPGGELSTFADLEEEDSHRSPWESYTPVTVATPPIRRQDVESALNNSAPSFFTGTALSTAGSTPMEELFRRHHGQALQTPAPAPTVPSIPRSFYITAVEPSTPPEPTVPDPCTMPMPSAKWLAPSPTE